MLKQKGTLFKIFSISYGFTAIFTILEIFARIAPATNIFPLQKPIECISNKNITLNCLHRRKPYSTGTWAAGKFKPFNKIAFKRANDIGQFSDVDFKEFIKNEKNKIQILSIGDSYTEGLQVKNSSTYHGILNRKLTKNKKQFISTAIAASGMALPNYIASINYSKELIDLDNIILIISITSDDFDESFKEYALKGRRNGLGQFYFNENNSKMYFMDFPNKQNLTQKLIEFFLKNSSLTRYLVYNLNLSNGLSQNFKFLTTQKENHKHNTENRNALKKENASERFEMGELAIDIFIKKLKEIRKNKFSRKKTFLVVDADRNSIYKNTSPNKNSFFLTMRNQLIKKARGNGFKVIDMEPIFQKDFTKRNLKFNSLYDGHWNEYGHKKVSDEIINLINDL